MKTQKLILLLVLGFSLGSCQQIEKSATPTVSPSTALPNNFQQITSYWGSPILSSYDGTGKNPKLYFSVIAQPDELKKIISKVDQPEKLQSIDLSKDILIMIEWGMYFSGGIKVDVTEVKIKSNQAEIIVDTFLPDPKTAQAATFSSALDFITISRVNFDSKTPVKFVLLNKGAIISSISVEFH
jgi:hypothetical protein